VASCFPAGREPLEPPWDDEELEEREPFRPKRASAVVASKKHPAASAAHNVNLGPDTG
jgi:hypothetical protein